MTARAIVWATVDEAAGIALITGKGHDDLVQQVAPRAPWSRSGRGWLLSLPELGDLACLCDHERVVFRERVKR